MSRRFDLSRSPFVFFRMTDSSHRIRAISIGPSRLPSRVQRVCATGVVVFIFIFLRGGQGGYAGREGYDIVCTHRGSSNGDRTPTQPTVLKDGCSRTPSGSSRQRLSRKARGTNLGSWTTTDAST